MNWKEVKDFATKYNILVMKTRNEDSYEIHSYWDDVDIREIKDVDEAMKIVNGILKRRSEQFRDKNNMWGS